MGWFLPDRIEKKFPITEAKKTLGAQMCIQIDRWTDEVKETSH